MKRNFMALAGPVMPLSDTFPPLHRCFHTPDTFTFTSETLTGTFSLLATPSKHRYVSARGRVDNAECLVFRIRAGSAQNDAKCLPPSDLDLKV